MPDKEGSDDEKKSTKSVINKKQKQMMGEEGYDIARDQGRVRPSKDKKDATTLRKPPSKEMKKTQKVNKGPSALDIVKKKYKGQIMNVGKKKVKEELDLTQVAEAFGGYIVEGERVIIKKRGEPGTMKGGKTIIAPVKGQEKAESDLITNLQLTGRLKIPTTKKKKTTPSLTRNMATNKEIEDAEKEFKGDTNNNKKTDTTKPIRDEKGNIIANPPDPTKQEIERKTKEVKDQSRKTRGSKEPLIRQTEYTSDTRRASEDPVSYGKGDGRKAGRTSQERKTGKVTYQTFVNKPEVTGGQDRATDTRSSVYIPKPETKPET